MKDKSRVDKKTQKDKWERNIFIYCNSILSLFYNNDCCNA